MKNSCFIRETLDRMKKSILLTLYPILSFSQQHDSTALHYAQFIKADTMSKYLHILASDAYEGRETGKKGQKMASEYIAGQFKINNVTPYKDNSYFQQFTLEENERSSFYQEPHIYQDRKEFVSGTDYYLLKGKAQLQINAKKVLFLGYGIEDDHYNDYKNKTVQDKIIMILDHEPFSPNGSSYITGNKSASEWTTFYKKKIEKAYEKGVAVLFIVDLNFEENIQKNKTRSAFMKLKTDKPEMPVFYISKTMANFILAKENIENIKNEIDRKGKPVFKTKRTRMNMIIKNQVEQIQSENVIGFIEGTDLKDEVVVLSAHYDHLGKQGDVIYNGADDDASGTSAVITLAKVFAKAKSEGHGPRRTILCIAFTGEEKGLLGSRYYVEHPAYPLKNTICDLNIDMIGRIDEKHQGDPNYIYVIGSDKLSSQLHTINENSNNSYCNLKLDYMYNDYNDKNRFYYRSDHYNFAKNGIPVIFYFNGVHADYHKETDDVEKIDFKKMEKITRLVFFTAWKVANQQNRLVIDLDKK